VGGISGQCVKQVDSARAGMKVNCYLDQSMYQRTMLSGGKGCWQIQNKDECCDKLDGRPTTGNARWCDGDYCGGKKCIPSKKGMYFGGSNVCDTENVIDASNTFTSKKGTCEYNTGAAQWDGLAAGQSSKTEFPIIPILIGVLATCGLGGLVMFAVLKLRRSGEHKAEETIAGAMCSVSEASPSGPKEGYAAFQTAQQGEGRKGGGGPSGFKPIAAPTTQGTSEEMELEGLMRDMDGAKADKYDI